MSDERGGDFADYYRVVLGARALGLLFIGIGIRIVSPLATQLLLLFTTRDDRGVPYGGFGTLLSAVTSKEVLLSLVAWNAKFAMVLILGVFLLRVDPRKLLPIRGAHA